MNLLEFGDEIPSSNLIDRIFLLNPDAQYGIQSDNSTQQVIHEKIIKHTNTLITVGWIVQENDFIPPKPGENFIWDSGDRSWIEITD